MAYCKRCGRELTTPESIERGYGYFCAKHANTGTNQLSFDFGQAEEKIEICKNKENLVQLNFHCYEPKPSCAFFVENAGHVLLSGESACVWQGGEACCENKKAIIDKLLKYLDGEKHG